MEGPQIVQAWKEWREDFSSGIPEMNAEGELLRAVERLTEFESRQK